MIRVFNLHCKELDSPATSMQHNKEKLEFRPKSDESLEIENKKCTSPNFRNDIATIQQFFDPHKVTCKGRAWPSRFCF